VAGSGSRQLVVSLNADKQRRSRWSPLARAWDQQRCRNGSDFASVQGGLV